MMLSARRIALADVTPGLAGEWMELVEVTGADLSLAPEWFKSTADSRHVTARAGIFAVRRAGRLIGVLPHVERHERIGGVPVFIAEATGSFLVAYHPDVIAGEEKDAVLEAIVRECRTRYDVLVLPNFPSGDCSTLAAVRIAREQGVLMGSRAGHVSPYLSINTEWDEFVAGKDKKFRYKVRNGMKELAAAGAVTEEWFTTEAGLGKFFADMLSIEAHSWKAAAEMAVSGSDMERSFYEQLLPFLVRRDALRANVLYLDGSPVAYSLCYLWRGAFRQLKTSFDDGHAKLSPGSAVLQSAIRHAFSVGAREFDFLGDAMLHKNQWASGIREHTTLHLFLHTWRGRLAGSLRGLADRFRGVTAARQGSPASGKENGSRAPEFAKTGGA